MKKLIILLCFHFLSASDIDIPKNIQQLLVVSVDTPKQNHAILHAYERDSTQSPWKFVFDGMEVRLGRNGLGLGLGLHSKDFNNELKLVPKFEGDGKSPAGIFRLSQIFGYSPLTPNSKMPYIQAKKKLHCVDDSNSEFYNQIITQRDAYTSFESMRREDKLYELGIVVAHNSKGVKKRGSCIFIHVMSATKGTTAGCTAMSKENILKIIKWLDQTKNPTLLQYVRSY